MQATRGRADRGAFGSRVARRIQLVVATPRLRGVSWPFGQRVRQGGLLVSMGSIGDCFDNSMAESFFGTLQLELLD